MANETTVTVNVETDISSLEELSTLLDELNEKGETLGSSLTYSFEGLDSSLISISTNMEMLNESITSAGDNLNNINSEELDNAAESADRLSDSLANIDGSGLEDASVSAAGLAGELDGVAESTEQVDESTKTFSDNTTGWITVSEKVGEVSNQIGGLSSSFMALNDVVGTVSANTGYSADQVRNLASSYTSVGTSATDAATYLQRFQNAGMAPASAEMNTAMNNAHLLQTAFRLTGSEADSLMGALARAGIGAGNLSDSFNALENTMQFAHVKY